MATYAQLQAESYWNREIVTPELAWLGAELCRRTKRPQAAFGVKGDNRHLRGAHRSQEGIERSRFCTSRTYTVQSGLTAAQKRHLAGVDFNPGSEAQMVAQCKRIYAAMRAGKLDEVREFYGNVDGNKVVDGWDNVRNRNASSDSSHLWHWHLTLDRRHCANKNLMKRIVAITLGDTLEEDMPLTNDDAQIVRRQWGLGAHDLFHVMLTNQDYNGTDASTAQATLTKMTDILVPIVQIAVVPLTAQIAAQQATIDQLVRVIEAGGGSVDMVALKAEIRDAVADLGEGGAEQVRAG